MRDTGGDLAPCSVVHPYDKRQAKEHRPTMAPRRNLAIFTAIFLLSPLALAQGSPRVTSVDPAAGKINDTVSVMGESLGKGSVSAVFLSDDKDDTKAILVAQDAGKIVIKVPQVKPGSYNISVQAGDKIMILPVKFQVRE